MKEATPSLARKSWSCLIQKGSHLSTSNMASSWRYALSVKYISDFEDIIWKHTKYLAFYIDYMLTWSIFDIEFNIIKFHLFNLNVATRKFRHISTGQHWTRSNRSFN